MRRRRVSTLFMKRISFKRLEFYDNLNSVYDINNCETKQINTYKKGY